MENQQINKKINRKTNKKNKILWAITFVGIIIGSICLYNYHPKVYAYRYVFAYNKKDFEKVYSFYNEEAIEDKFEKQEIIEFLKEQSTTNNKIKPVELTMVKDKKTKKWFVQFPYKLQSIYVLAPTGANVYVDHKGGAQEVKGKGVEVKNMLPGKHQVTIEYYKDMVPPFTTEIILPNETQVISPYDTLDILVASPTGTWVTVGDITKQNTGEKLLFNNMLPGQYDISVFMGNRDIEVFSVNTQIDQQSPVVNIENIMGNEKVKEDLKSFFEKFNIDYKAGIMKKDTTFLHKFLTDKINEKVISDFKMWYVDHKDIKDAKSLMEVRDIYPISGTELKTSVLETVYLTNIEKDETGKDIEQQYRVVMEWNYKLLRHNSTWKIMSREIKQSIVAYKNEEGKWIKY